MSSHHIVREKQEPALLLLGLNTFANEALGQLLEWSPTVITTALTAETLNSLGIKIDLIISEGPTEAIQSNVKFIQAEKDSPTETALKFLLANNYPAVNIVADDFDIKDYEFYVDKFNIVIFNNYKKIYAINSGFSKWKPSGELIELLGVADELQFSGLEMINQQKYRTTSDGFFSIHFNQAFLFITEEL